MKTKLENSTAKSNPTTKEKWYAQIKQEVNSLLTNKSMTAENNPFNKMTESEKHAYTEEFMKNAKKTTKEKIFAKKHKPKRKKN